MRDAAALAQALAIHNLDAKQKGDADRAKLTDSLLSDLAQGKDTPEGIRQRAKLAGLDPASLVPQRADLPAVSQAPPDIGLRPPPTSPYNTPPGPASAPLPPGVALGLTQGFAPPMGQQGAPAGSLLMPADVGLSRALVGDGQPAVELPHPADIIPPEEQNPYLAPVVRSQMEQRRQSGATAAKRGAYIDAQIAAGLPEAQAGNLRSQAQYRDTVQTPYTKALTVASQQKQAFDAKMNPLRSIHQQRLNGVLQNQLRSEPTRQKARELRNKLLDLQIRDFPDAQKFRRDMQQLMTGFRAREFDRGTQDRLTAEGWRQWNAQMQVAKATGYDPAAEARAQNRQDALTGLLTETQRKRGNMLSLPTYDPTTHAPTGYKSITYEQLTPDQQETYDALGDQLEDYQKELDQFKRGKHPLQRRKQLNLPPPPPSTGAGRPFGGSAPPGTVMTPIGPIPDGSGQPPMRVAPPPGLRVVPAQHARPRGQYGKPLGPQLAPLPPTDQAAVKRSLRGVGTERSKLTPQEIIEHYRTSSDPRERALTPSVAAYISSLGYKF